VISNERIRRNVKRVALARAISLAGIDASAIALSYGLFLQTRSPAWLAAGMLVTFGLGTVLGPIGGRIADVFDRKRLMIGCEIAGAAAFAMLFFWQAPTAMLGISVIATIAGLIFGPAAGAAVPALAGGEDLARVNALLATGGNIGKTIGRVGSGIVIAAAGYASVFAVNAVTFIISAILIASVSGSFGDSLDSARGKLQKMSWRLPFKDDAVRPVLLSSCAATFMTSFSMTAETVLVFDFEAGPLGLGALTACWGLGMVGGSWYAGRVLTPDSEMRGLLAGRVAMGVSIATVGLTPWFWTTLPSYLIGGAGGGILLVASQCILQRSVPGGMLGQLLATTESIKTAALGLGLLCAGSAVAALGSQHTYLLVGVGVLIGAVPIALSVLGRRQSRSPRTAMAPVPAPA
jgi:MFS family permease